MKKWAKNSIGIAILLMIIGAFSMGWNSYKHMFLCHSEICTYRNEKYGFEFKYPKKREIIVNDTLDDFITTMFGFRPAFFAGHVRIDVYKFDGQKPNLVYSSYKDEDPTITPIVVDGVTGEKLRYLFVVWNSAITLPLHDGYRINISTSDEYKDELDQILSTFNFLEK